MIYESALYSFLLFFFSTRDSKKNAHSTLLQTPWLDTLGYKIHSSILTEPSHYFHSMKFLGKLPIRICEKQVTTLSKRSFMVWNHNNFSLSVNVQYLYINSFTTEKSMEEMHTIGRAHRVVLLLLCMIFLCILFLPFPPTLCTSIHATSACEPRGENVWCTDM